jgi:serine/threonine protein kinase
MTDVKTVIETVVPVSAEGEVAKGKVEKKGGKRIGYNYIILKSLKESPKNDVVKCIYIKSLVDFGVCVIKEGTAGELKDKHDRDIKDRLIWQKELHELLQDKVRVPKYIGSFEENGNYYLAIEHIKGKTLGYLFKKYGKQLREGLLTGNKLGLKFLGYLLQIVDLLDVLHRNHVVHRDVTANNFIITPHGKVAIIDLELSYSLTKEMPNPPFQLGTYGYMSPQQLAVEIPTVKEDVFSVGAIMLQLWTNIAPVKLTHGSPEDLKERVHFFIPDEKVANIVLQCLDADAAERPALNKVYQDLKQFREDVKKKRTRVVRQSPPIEKERVETTIREVIHTLTTPLLVDKERGWFAENLRPTGKIDRNHMQKGWYTSFHLGGTGVLYTLCKAYLIGFDIGITRPHIQQTLSMIEERYINRIDKAMPGLHFGADGISACLAEALYSGLIEPSEKYLDWVERLLTRKAKIPGVMWGIAGQGIANLLSLDVANNKQEIKARLAGYADHLLEKQDKSGAWIKDMGPKDKKGKVTRGFANGMAGIVYFLLEYGRRFGDSRSVSGAEQGLQWLIKNSVSGNNGLEWRSSEGKELSPWWCDGNPGIALAFIKAYTSSGNPLYKKFATDALHYHQEKVLDNNLGQYNGLSGLGEIYLEAYQSFQDGYWLERAGWIVQLIMRLKKEHRKFGPHWLIEHEKQPVPGFMLGNAGILHFLMRYCYPDKIGFPMLPAAGKAKVTTGHGNGQLLIQTSDTLTPEYNSKQI